MIESTKSSKVLDLKQLTETEVMICDWSREQSAFVKIIIYNLLHTIQQLRNDAMDEGTND